MLVLLFIPILLLFYLFIEFSVEFELTDKSLFFYINKRWITADKYIYTFELCLICFKVNAASEFNKWI